MNNTFATSAITSPDQKVSELPPELLAALDLGDDAPPTNDEDAAEE